MIRMRTWGAMSPVRAVPASSTRSAMGANPGFSKAGSGIGVSEPLASACNGSMGRVRFAAYHAGFAPASLDAGAGARMVLGAHALGSSRTFVPVTA